MLRDRPEFPGPIAVPAVPRMAFVRGHEAILKLGPALEKLAARCGQAGEMDSLLYFLSKPDALKKRPWLVLVGSAQTAPDPASASGATAAVLLFEYMALPKLAGARIFGTTDGTGRRNLLAPRGQRAATAAQVAAALIRRGAQMAQIDFSEDHTDSDRHPGDPHWIMPYKVPPAPVAERRATVVQTLRSVTGGLPAGQWSLFERDKMLYLPLLPTFDQTLARIGQKTRANLRYYRRRAEAELGCVFSPRISVDRETFMEFSRHGFSPVTDQVASDRYDLLDILPNGYLAGLRDRDGKWLSMIRGRIQNDFLEVDWLINRAEMPEASLGTVVRSYLLEHAIHLGCTRMYIEGGTAMTLKYSFIRGPVSELTLKRASPYMRALEALSRKKPVRHHIAETLRDDSLQWSPW